MTDRKEIEAANREVAEWLGLCWWEYRMEGYGLYHWKCVFCGRRETLKLHDNPDFTTKSGRVELLELMMKRKDFGHFIVGIGTFTFDFMNYLLDNSGKLLLAVRDWKRLHP